jgi:hypothetical protein
MSKTLSYKNSIENDSQDRIKLTTLKGKIGYKIKKFQVMNNQPSSQDYEQVYKIYKVPQSSITNVVDLSDNDLLGVVFDNGQGGTPGRYWNQIILDTEIFNQDIYVTMIAASGGGTTTGNYYIELEAMNITDLQATQLTLKSLRNIASR